MSILPALSIARGALLVNEAALAVAGRNVANVNTPGYTRQVVELGARAAGGVEIAAITRVLDPLLVRRLLTAETAHGEQEARRDQLGALSAVLSELDAPGVGSALDGFFDAAAALERNPQGLPERQLLLTRATALAAELGRRHAAVAALQRAVDDRIVALARQADADLRQVADLNRAILAAEAQGEPAGELRDRRQQVVGHLAGLLPVSATEDAHGALTVSTATGSALVVGDVAHGVAVVEGAAGLDARPLHALVLTTASGTLTAPEVFGGGELGGLVGVRDGGIARAAAALDTLANALAGEVNAIQTDPAARDLQGNPTTSAPLFAGTGAADLRVVLDDPARLAAALSADATDNANASRLAALRTRGLPALGSLTLTAWVGAQQAALGEDAAAAADRAAASGALREQLESQRASLSGVNLNEETANMLAYQRAFQAATQVVQVANAMLDDLFEAVR